MARHRHLRRPRRTHHPRMVRRRHPQHPLAAQSARRPRLRRRGNHPANLVPAVDDARRHRRARSRTAPAIRRGVRPRQPGRTTGRLLDYYPGRSPAAVYGLVDRISVARITGREDLLAEALAQLALANQALGAGTEALTTAEELRSVQPRLSNPRSQVMALLGMAQVALAAGDADQARIDASIALRTARRSDDFLRAASSGFWLAYALALAGALPSARAVIAEAAQDAARCGYQLMVADNLMAEVSLALADRLGGERFAQASQRGATMSLDDLGRFL